MHQLDLIEGERKLVRVIQRVASRWEDIATRLYFETHDVKRIKVDHHYQTIPCCATVFTEWLDGKGRQPATWLTLVKVIEEAEFSELAVDLKKCIPGN